MKQELSAPLLHEQSGASGPSKAALAQAGVVSRTAAQSVTTCPSTSAARLPAEKTVEFDTATAKGDERSRAVSNVSDGLPDKRFSDADDARSDFSSDVNDDANDLENVKAQTMHNMIEEFTDKEGFTKQIIFLTNKQAKTVLKSENRVQRLLEALDMTQPKLLIHLCSSIDPGDIVMSKQCYMLDGAKMCMDLPGLECLDPKNPERIPYESSTDYYDTIRRLARFMREVILPLAIQTNAVLCIDGHQGQCILAKTLGFVVSQERARWSAGTMPFTIMAFVNAQPLLYKHERPEDAHWTHVRHMSKNWRRRHPRMLELMADNPGWGYWTDIDPTASIYIVCDSIDDRRTKSTIGNLTQGNQLQDRIISHFKKTIPAVAFKTGMTWKETPTFHACSGFSVVVDLLAGGVPVVLLDLRDRTKHGHDARLGRGLTHGLAHQLSRQDSDDRKAKAIQEMLESSSQFGLPEVMDVCTVSYVHSVMVGNTLDDNSDHSHRKFNPLCDELAESPAALNKLDPGDAFENCTREHSGAVISTVMETVARVTDHFYDQCWEKLPEEIKTANKYSQKSDRFEVWRQTWFDQIIHIMSKKDFLYSLNVSDLISSKACVRELVKLDRLPPFNPKEGMKLLRRAWDMVDISTQLGSQFKSESKLSFAIQLCIQVILTILAVVSALVRKSLDDGGDRLHDRLNAAAFAFATLSSMLLSFNAVRNPVKRWKQLRGNALQLESQIWQYRSRIGIYATHQSDDGVSERMFMEMSQSWLERLLGSADIAGTDIFKTYPKAVYTHFQYDPPSDPTVQEDDHQSPLNPHRYIRLRILPMKQFYSERISPYVRWRYLLIAVVLLLGSVSSFMGFCGFTVGLAIPSALANCLTAWSEFTDIGNKISRYNDVVCSLEKLLVWWESLGEVEQASTTSVTILITTAEQVIANEFSAWQSIASLCIKSKRQEGKDESDKTVNPQGHSAHGEGAV